MAMNISQREARRLRKRVEELEERDRKRLAQWSAAYPGGTHMQTLALTEVSAATLNATKRLGFVMVAKIDGSAFHIYAVKP